MWVYDNEIESIAGDFENGDIVTVHDFDGFFLGIGFINTRSKLTVRLLSRKKGTVIDDAFLEKRVQNAWDYRKQTVDTGCCRLIFGEADWLPGLVVDKFGLPGGGIPGSWHRPAQARNPGRALPGAEKGRHRNTRHL